MNTPDSYTLGENNTKNSSEKNEMHSSEEQPQTSLPNEPPVGPFEHSGEVAGWTKEEEETDELHHKAGDGKSAE